MSLKDKKELLIQRIKIVGILKSKVIEDAIRLVDRFDFVPENLRDFAYDDEPLPIGYGQTISQPSTVIFMLELLDVQVGQRIMDVGFGSGWQTALLAHLVGEKGQVYAFEIVKELCLFGENNLKKYPELTSRIFFFCKSAKTGFIEEKIISLDRVIVAADIETIPKEWRESLMIGGIMVYPRRGSLYKEIKNPDGTFTKNKFYGFSFVPFV